jgi:hypoxanthine phosphoribosyltransferase
MAHVLAQADVGDGDQIGAFRFDRPQRFLDNAIFCISTGGLFIFLFRNAEKQDSLYSKILSSTRFIGNLFHRQLKDSGHARDRPTVIQFFTYKQRENEIVNAQLCLADEISQSGRTPQAARAMQQSSHEASVRVAKLRRKQEQQRRRLGVRRHVRTLNLW